VAKKNVVQGSCRKVGRETAMRAREEEGQGWITLEVH